MGERDTDLEEAFIAFAAFGSSRNLATGDVPAAGLGWALNSASFAKLTRESGIIGSVVTLTDIDIIFNQCKVGRKLDFTAFKRSLELIAEKRGCSVDHLKALIIASEPKLNGTVPDLNPIVEKLTDASLYTGSHRERFDRETGVGKGAAGRDTFSATASLSHIVSRHNPNTTLGSPKVHRPTPTVTV
ncbi:hypothetical protein HDU67_003494 [Dinochytrium kinnereticum]|nr:hypothetical protein HDU67_003494 [Dinochytrium kinnereticum]